MRGITMTQAVGGGGTVDRAGGASQAISHLDRTDARGLYGFGHGLAQGERAVSPSTSRGRKEKPRISMRAPPAAELLHHGRGDRDVTILAAFAIANVQAGRIFVAVDVGDLNGNGFTDAQPTVIHESQTGRETWLTDRSKQSADFLA